MSENYHPLSEAEAIEHAKKLSALFSPAADLVCREIGDGNLNLVFHIQDRTTGQGVILKQALPYAKIVGESWPLTLDRARIESEALQLQGRLCREHAPQVYTYVPELALTVMEDLSDHEIMRKALMRRDKFPLFAGHIARFLANTLFFTSDLGLNQQEKKLRVKQFINPELCKITEDLIFDHPYTDAETNNFEPAIRNAVEQIWKDMPLQLEVALLRERFLTHAQALLHGDLHTGSIFVTETSTKVIDPEFAFYGPMGFDIGAVFANLLLNYAAQEGWSRNDQDRRDYREYLLQTVTQIWERFAAEFADLWDRHLVDRMASTPGYRDNYMQRLLQDTVGFTGAKMIRRVIGLAHAADLDKIEDPLAREKAQRMTLAIGRSLILRHRKVESVNEIVSIVKQVSGDENQS
ncbi:S-methyl-5-thioribose kinase [Ferviditalea candida]|uniref:Methylthioribose kinase n=1 Tax=Ferviditalea candida TaxID=3108399 RepID=A0ABU5ZIS0_9BACL|nr:S-methyl-5-thioribose kinase [Paenibacillaceae bacterium T2]